MEAFRDLCIVFFLAGAGGPQLGLNIEGKVDLGVIWLFMGGSIGGEKTS